MRAARFRSALAVAVGAHVVIALALERLPAPSASTIAPPASELEIVVEQDRPFAPPSAEGTSAKVDDSRASAVSGARALVARAAAEERTTSGAVVEVPREGEPTPAPAASGEPWSLSGPAPMDLRVGDYWKSVAMGGVSRPTPSPEASTRSTAPPSDAISRMLRDDLQARDVALGLGAAGPLVAAAHDAATPDIAPDVGAVTLEIESDATGRIISARVVDATADAAAWNDVAQRVVRLMASKPLRVAPGARGVRARLRIVAERSLPAGERREARPGATPDSACDTSGGGRRCLAGLPAGASGTWGDLSNIGAKRSRIVHVQVLGESSI